MEQVLIQRQGSYFYTKAYRSLFVGLTLVYLVLGVLLGIISSNMFDSNTVGILAFGFVVAVVAVMWGIYQAILWVFARESRQQVEITDNGIRERHNSREHAFIPWAGVKEIEVAATIVAGASLRVHGNFSDISISNVDLMITRPMSIREMHRALGQTNKIGELLRSLRSAAPQATLRMNRLARRRIKSYAWAGDIASR